MGWQPGSAFFGVGLAGVMYLTPPGTIPHWLLPLLLSSSILLILVWPVSVAIAKLFTEPKGRLVASIRTWSVLVGLSIIGAYHVPIANPPKEDQSTPHLVVESMPSSSTVVPQGNQRCSTKVARLAGLKVKNVGGVRITNVRIVVLQTNDFVAPFQLQLPVSSMDVLFDCPNPQPVQVSVNLNPGDDAFFGAVIECNGKAKTYCPNGKLGIPYVDNYAISFLLPVEKNIERFDKFTVRASGDGVSAVTKQFEVKLTTDGSLALE